MAALCQTRTLFLKKLVTTIGPVLMDTEVVGPSARPLFHRDVEQAPAIMEREETPCGLWLGR